MLPTITPLTDETEPPASHACTRRRSYYTPSGGPHDVRAPLRRTCHGLAWQPTHESALPATVPVWSGAADWLSRLGADLDGPQGATAREQTNLSIRTATVLDVAAVDARAANSRTGRDVMTAHETVATELGCSPKTVQRARTLIAALGYALTVARGRYLTTQERETARRHHGQNQLRMASRRALVVPRRQRNVHLPRRGDPSAQGLVRQYLPKHAQARAEAAPRPAPTRRTARRQGVRPPLGVQQLAAKITERLPWLRGTHIWALCRTLMALGVDDRGWTAQDIIDLLDRRNVTLGLYSVASSSQRAPLRLFAHQLRHALGDVTEPPRQAREREREVVAAQRERECAARAELVAQLEAERRDPEAQARIAATKASIRADLARHRAEARWRH